MEYRPITSTDFIRIINGLQLNTLKNREFLAPALLKGLHDDKFDVKKPPKTYSALPQSAYKTPLEIDTYSMFITGAEANQRSPWAVPSNERASRGGVTAPDAS